MPIFQYQCRKCNRIKEYLVLKGDFPTCCGFCGYDKIDRVIHGQTFGIGSKTSKEGSDESLEGPETKSENGTQPRWSDFGGT